MAIKSELLDAGPSVDCAIFEVMGLLSGRIEDASPDNEGPEVVEESWSSECGPEAPRVDKVEDSLPIVNDVVHAPATELVSASEGPKLLRLLPKYVGGDA